MTQAALLRIVRQARKTALFRWVNGAGWTVCPLPRRESLYIECDSQGFDWRGREHEAGDDDPGHAFTTVQAAAAYLRGDEVIRLQCWGRMDDQGGREMLDLWHLDLATGEKVEIAPGGVTDFPDTPIENPTTTGVLPGGSTGGHLG